MQAKEDQSFLNKKLIFMIKFPDIGQMVKIP